MTQMTMPSPQDIDPDYHWNFVRFTAQGRFFCVPDYRFIEGSEYFASKYGLKNGSITPSTDFEVVDMNAEKPPQVIDLDVTIKDFRPLLTVLYPKTADAVAQITEEGWLSILRLSTKWSFDDLRKTAVDKLKGYVARMCPVERIKLAKELSHAPWALSGYTELVTRPERVTVQVAREIGLEIAIELCGMREGRHVSWDPPSLTESGIKSILSCDFPPEVLEVASNLGDEAKSEAMELVEAAASPETDLDEMKPLSNKEKKRMRKAEEERRKAEEERRMQERELGERRMKEEERRKWQERELDEERRKVEEERSMQEWELEEKQMKEEEERRMQKRNIAMKEEEGKIAAEEEAIRLAEEEEAQRVLEVREKQRGKRLKEYQRRLEQYQW
ncbi:hypothetical protein FA15DRAFT_620728 [Coprinopsis marcescibilis]|uniref:BTB domain-containing protein n=1 Tax=Coprinopsis marcescibilis TaxID=230819 RepID=A0A5C3L5N4_COPMA|nr:hypothetical protein FA15DRAFT_620728 [Coprinopsis marcescibilis]